MITYTHFTRGTRLYVPDKTIGGVLAPNVTVHRKFVTTEWTVITNDKGFRCRSEYEKAMPVDIVMLGCSWVKGVGLNYEDTASGIIESKSGMTVANLGVGSYSMLQCYLLLQQHIEFLKPKYVIYCHGEWLMTRCFKQYFLGRYGRPFYCTMSGEIKVHKPIQRIEKYWYALISRLGFKLPFSLIDWNSKEHQAIVYHCLYNHLLELTFLSPPLPAKLIVHALPSYHKTNHMRLPDDRHPNAKANMEIATNILKRIGHETY